MRSFNRDGHTWLILTVMVLVIGICGSVSSQPFPPACPGALDYIDSTYGGAVRQLHKPDGHEHNLYHHRNPWNANNTYMIGVEEDLDHTDGRVTLYDGNGCFIKELFPVNLYKWQLVWDRNDPAVLYVWRSTRLYRYHVETETADLIKNYKPTSETIIVAPTLNQAGDRILVVTTPGPAFRSYQLPDMTNERAFTLPALPDHCDLRNVRYIGYQNYIAVSCRNSTEGPFTEIYDDTGTLLHHFSRGFGHSDFSPNGQWAYPVLPTITAGTKTPLEIHVVNIDGTNDQILYSVPFEDAVSMHNLHLTWPDNVNEWFVVSFYPNATAAPAPYASPFDEVLLLSTDGTQRWLARTWRISDVDFWSQPLASPSSDGSRISFHSDCSNTDPFAECTDSGTTDHYILFPEFTTSPYAEAHGSYSSDIGVAVNFSSAGSDDPDGNIVSYEWDFGDGSAVSILPNPHHIYDTAGEFTAKLRVTDNDGLFAIDTALVIVAGGGGNQAPMAEANGPYSGAVGSSIIFSNAGSNDPDGTIVSYSWDFGDGSPLSAKANPRHKYTSAGTFTATLTVTDNDGATGTDAAIVTIGGGGN